MNFYSHRSMKLCAAFTATVSVVLAACGAPAPTAAPVAEPTAAPAVEATQTPVVEPTAMGMAEPTAAATEGAKHTVRVVASSVHRIDAARSTARFTLNEKLMGNPVTVIGETSGIEGEITLDKDAPAQSKIGELKIDARGFKTDSGRRDGAIARFILESNRDEYQFITFTPTKIEGLPEKIETEAPVSFKVTGDLKIRDVSAPVTFDVTASLHMSGVLTGTAKAQVLRSTFGLEIPSVPSVADVTDEVVLELDFVAVP